MTADMQPWIAQLALADHPVATLVVDLGGHVLFANAAARKAFGAMVDGPATLATLEGWTTPGTSLPELLGQIAGSSNWVPVRLQRDGQVVPARARGVRQDRSRPPLVLMTYFNDLSEPFVEHAKQIRQLNRQLALQRETEAQLRAAMEISEGLKRELVHRVKNNLAIISSLLRSQARSSGENSTSLALETAASRIRSIAVVHDLLDANREVEILGTGQLLTDLLTHIRDAICPPEVVLDGRFEDAEIHVERALPLALLTNELVTNAIKHAFPGQDGGRVEIAFRPDAGGYRLDVVDDGIGLPKGGDGNWLTPRIVAALATQLDARLECTVEGGTAWSLHVPSLDKPVPDPR
ncbi:sensor histidine kinase [Halovulum sp. GXIMD14794]